MGDRSNLLFRTKGGGIGVYAHWAGLAMADAAARVLRSRAFKSRLGDPNYAIRIGVQLALEALGAESAAETGFGLWTPATGPDDNEYRYVIIDVDTGQVYVATNWKKPRTRDRVTKPTSAEIRRRMQGEPSKPKTPKRRPPKHGRKGSRPGRLREATC
jgi:hypothetical protein